MKNNSQDIPLNFAPKNPNIDSMCFLLGPVAQDRPAKPPGPRPRPVPAAMLAGRLNMPSPTTDLTWQFGGTKSSRLMKKKTTEVKAELLFIGGPRGFSRGWSKSQRKSKTWRWHNCGGWSHLLHMKPLWKQMGNRVFPTKEGWRGMFLFKSRWWLASSCFQQKAFRDRP